MNDDNIKILITGDLCPINRIQELALQGNFEEILNDFVDVFKENDLNVVDLECPLTTSETARPKIGPHQKAHPDCINLLKFADINLATLANNHIMDYDIDGLTETQNLLRKNGINTTGIGGTAIDVSEPFSLSVKKKKIAILNYADDEFISTTDKSLSCNSLDTIRCLYDIQNAKKNHDFVILTIHAGNEFYELPSPRTKRMYRYLIDLGADVIISNHTHAFSGYEMYKSKLICYGLGNFIYDWPGKNDESWNRGYVVRLILSERLDFEIIPLKQGNTKPGVFHLNAEETEAFNKEISRLNQIIADNELLEAEFQKYCKSVFPRYDAYIEPYFGKNITFLRTRGFFPKLMPRRKRLLLLNITRCESHRDVLIRMLSRYE